MGADNMKWWTIYWTKINGVPQKEPQRDSGYCVNDLNYAHRSLEGSYVSNIKRAGSEWEGFVDEWK